MKANNLQQKSLDFDRPVDRRNTASMKWDKYEDKDILPLWVADMDFVSPSAVIASLKQRAEHGVFGYTRPPQELTRELRQVLERQYGWPVAAEWIVWLPGVVPGLNISCRAVGEDNDDVITAVPVYQPFLTAPKFSGRNLVSVPLVQNQDRWEFDFDLLEKNITPRTRLLLLCSPHNPVGRVFTEEELLKVAEICEKHDIVICSDEIHCDLILDEDKYHIPTAALAPEIADRTITLMAPSKTYNLPGLGCSFAVISNSKLRHRFKKTMAGIVPSVNAMGFVATLATYRNGEEWLMSLLAYLRANRELVTDAIKKMPAVSMTHVEATYLAWIDTRATGLDDPVKFFENAGVGLSDGRDFSGPGYVRLNFGCSRATLEEALKRMGRGLNRLAG
jgi:cystathionine beta-lyase